MSLDPLAIPSTSPPPTSPSRNRSILTKFTNRFNNRNRNISEFYVQPDNPWKTYFPGDVVKGSVVLTVVKPIRITHLVVCLHGYAKVYKNAVPPGEGAQDSGFLGPGRGRRHGEYLGNGFSSLFEDEVVLCGDGRLKEGIYKFRFEMEFPPYSLPSSINFERGTISYMITSTLTRPTTISPTMSCDKRIIFLETIDIASLSVPKPRVISLEPVSKRPKVRQKPKNTSSENIPPGLSPTDPTPNGVEGRPPLSPVPSEISNSSCLSNSTQSFQVVSEPNSANSTSLKTDEVQESRSSISEKTITATTELLRGGALPGDVLPIKININHTKPVRSPHGIIVTFYRQGRIDMHPTIPVGTIEKGKKPIYEDCYPKSRTGLGGLSFGATRTNSVFRKDLSQSFAPLIVDPNTMTATVKTSVRVPEDIFPTITRVPGSMISFRYYVEVVMDLRGKLTGQDRFLPRLNRMTGGASSYSYNTNGNNAGMGDKGRNQPGSNWGPEILDTDQIRREKSVVACVFEVLIGSTDSGRGQQQQQQASAPDNSNTPHTQNDLPATPGTVLQTNNHETHPWQPAESQHPEQSWGDQDGYYHGYNNDEYGSWNYPPPEGYPPFPPGHFVPPEQPEEEVDEKTRLRRAEEVLLPSVPPQVDEAGPSTTIPAHAPSAPVLYEQDGFYDYPPDTADSANLTSTPTMASSPSVDTITPTPRFNSQDATTPGPSSSNADGAAEQSSSTAADDKRELERRRLLSEASAPDAPDGPSVEPSAPSGSGEDRTAPSAPVLTEDDIIHHTLPSGEALPRYHR